jgi:hypothetical protein
MIIFVSTPILHSYCIPSICTSGLRAAGPRLVGDGGAAWRRKALLRATEQAKEAGVSVEEFVKDRWGVRASLVLRILRAV